MPELPAGRPHRDNRVTGRYVSTPCYSMYVCMYLPICNRFFSCKCELASVYVNSE